MKVLGGLIFISSALRAYTASTDALVYTFDRSESVSNSKPPSISPNTARLLLAQRLGLSQHHQLGDADETILQILNNYGGDVQAVFAHEEDQAIANKLLLIVEGVEDPGDILDPKDTASFSIHDLPDASSNMQLALDLLAQDQYDKSRESQLCLLRSSDESLVLRGGINSVHKRNEKCELSKNSVNGKYSFSALGDMYDSLASASSEKTGIFYASLQDIPQRDKTRYAAALSDLKDFIQRSLEKAPRHLSTLVLMPPSPKMTKRKTSFSYGSYSKPLPRRQQRQTHEEEPLSAPSSPSISTSPSSPQILQTNSTLPPGILPVCHTSLESCISTTNNCSGHGTPFKKAGGKPDCYACKCGKTSNMDSEGRVNTIHWGGPACQKKDVSVPFFLLAGLTIGLVATVSWGVGLLVSIGQEDLPSVIGAGVAGPRAQK